MSLTAMTDNHDRKLTGRHVALMMVAFFAVIFAVNAYFIFIGLKTFPGLVTEEAYQEGLAFNQELASVRANDALGWHTAFTWTDAGLRVDLADRDRRPLDGLLIAATLSRPLGTPDVHEVMLTPRGNGTYVADLRLDQPGQWTVAIKAENGRTVFRAETRIFVRQ